MQDQDEYGDFKAYCKFALKWYFFVRMLCLCACEDVVGRVVYYHIGNLATVDNPILACGYDLHLLAIVPFRFLSRAGISFSHEESSTERTSKCRKPAFRERPNTTLHFLSVYVSYILMLLQK